MLILMAAASLLLAEATPAAQPAKPAAEAKAEAPKKPKLICVEEEQMGSHFKKRICRTKEEVDAERRAAERTNQAIGDHYAVCKAGNC